jgi:hypothetical protein
MGCGCGGKKRQIPNASNSANAYNPRPQTTQTTVTQQRCPKCSWPTRKFNHYDHKLKTFVNTFVCSNTSCRQRLTK